MMALIAIVAILVAYPAIWLLVSSSWPIATTLRHIASAPNCEFARLVGLAPARRGEPGYWKHHDRDGDGVACEPWPPWRGSASPPTIAVATRIDGEITTRAASSSATAAPYPNPARRNAST
ncbi:excalibur calcium-binding domain-containing protein [Bradyrhizobium jicamae]|nr:excalibur calcium-binding domain-containing protein [Bradyrhizobium jicamae]